MNKCINCGANLSVGAISCSYCSSPVSEDFGINLEDYIQLLEKKLVASKDSLDFRIGISFIALSGIWLYSSWYIYKIMHLLIFLGATAILGTILFVIFGFFVIHYETKSARGAFQKNMKNKLSLYLHTKGISKLEFEAKVSEILKPDSFLLKLFREEFK